LLDAYEPLCVFKQANPLASSQTSNVLLYSCAGLTKL